MRYFSFTFDSVSFPSSSGEKKEIENYCLGVEAQSQEEAQEKVIEFIESMGGTHGAIIKINSENKAPAAGQFPIKAN